MILLYRSERDVELPRAVAIGSLKGGRGGRTRSYDIGKETLNRTRRNRKSKKDEEIMEVSLT